MLRFTSIFEPDGLKLRNNSYSLGFQMPKVSNAVVAGRNGTESTVRQVKGVYEGKTGLPNLHQ
jgi:hypothetical protein